MSEKMTSQNELTEIKSVPYNKPLRQQIAKSLAQYTHFAWAGGTFFSVVLLCCISFWFWWEIGFGLHTHVGT